MLSATDITLRRGRRTLIRGFGLRVDAGDIVHLTGPNGAGKSTLLTTFCGLREPDAGEVRWQGQPIRKDRAAYLVSLWLVSHRRGLGRRATAEEALQLAGTLGGVSPGDLAHRVAVALDHVGLRAQAYRPVSQLSAGQQRRLALAKLQLAHKPLWLLDEPLTALDKAGVALVESMLDAHRAAGGLAVLTSHQPLTLGGVRTEALR